ncbi:MAG TPA: CoA-acylating methylmalonate-semialdehyde dehydrogenase [Acidimicrobiales bacterium]|jgi:malonate-semialdehyde dehydrogenase (acetylating)/methylmalonate-semialdehyde dehydrogenase|nr:CoA-acylating methylmalonate-semialdehyde dehydrogenase [Actinomycetes bacterium]MDP6104749.1 CoA-acylating methylmalonate-semialdehyde dehydrogenase [Acidimicrobiales bacterium]MDP6239694.1 CoA-acylating methylmalonate-semialdehyde dehydrogenase [Acidimicrobiales bacterium]MDP7124392.1 CoA-acylating methylmalonate-semialdehyde dehydrogenase [Acidimicrobiales bacterium]MDP7351180.1 CoA-acylating methylmalonate-semialdehyde dehydrogenase [Acidimicrobiales bacterium]|tara:strand:+ start:1894 stop:3381 length:1488 start_codon:yes stop_codon:yes gene_type:complete
MQQIHHLIDGEDVPTRSGRSGPVSNPATGDQTGEVGFASVEEVDRAVASSKAAFDEWRNVSIARRTRFLHDFRNLVVANADEIAVRLTAEHGKVGDDARGEVARGIENIEFACGLAEALKGTYSEQASSGVDVYTVRQPLGVCAGITPFNFPAMVPLWMLPNAVACGNTFVLKPSERDPSAPRFIVELAQEAGFPPGVVNLVNGDKVAVDRILDHPDVAAVSFVGSTPIARYVYSSGTANGKRVQALGGAKNHMVVLPDADLDLAADAAVSAAYGSAGERCMAISVVVAVGDIADDLVERIRVRMDKLVIGPGDDPASEMGPLITREHRDRVAGYVGSGADEGATVVVDGREQAFDGDGYFLGVSLLDHVTTDMQVYRDEVFGPVLSVVRSDTYHEAVQMIADNQYGNGAAIFTRDGGAAHQFQRDAEAGMVGINVPIPVPVGYHSFGGWNDSLFGDTTMYGPEGLRFYTRPKVITSRWPDPSTSTVDLGFPQND